MSSIIRTESHNDLNLERLDSICKQLAGKLRGRVKAAYLFGSSATGEFGKDSDIDLIIVADDPQGPFLERALAFKNLYEVFPRLDILVYTAKELEDQLADSQVGFWKSVRESMVSIL